MGKRPRRGKRNEERGKRKEGRGKRNGPNSATVSHCRWSVHPSVDHGAQCRQATTGIVGLSVHNLEDPVNADTDEESPDVPPYRLEYRFLQGRLTSVL